MISKENMLNIIYTEASENGQQLEDSDMEPIQYDLSIIVKEDGTIVWEE